MADPADLADLAGAEKVGPAARAAEWAAPAAVMAVAVKAGPAAAEWVDPAAVAAWAALGAAVAWVDPAAVALAVVEWVAEA
jgi:hypothetical protein